MAPANSISRIRLRVSIAFVLVWSFIHPPLDLLFELWRERDCRVDGSLPVHETGADVVCGLYGLDKDSSIADLTGSGGLVEDHYDVVDLVIVDGDFDHDLWKECQVVLDSAVDRSMPALAPMSSNLEHRHSGNDLRKLLNHIGEL